MDADKRKGLTMKKVSLRELVADKIIFSILIAMYYWMWARNDWKDYYTTVQDVILLSAFIISFPAPSGSKNTSRNPPMKWLKPTCGDAMPSV